MIRAIIYTSNTGSTATYAKLLGELINLPAYPLSEARDRVSAGSEVIYMGWLMASGIKAAVKRYSVCAVCGVGMGRTGTQLEEVRKSNRISSDTPLFTLQGGFDRQKLRGVYRFMMNIMAKTAGKALAEKQNRTSEEDEMLSMMLHGGNRVSIENLNGILEWYKKRA